MKLLYTIALSLSLSSVFAQQFQGKVTSSDRLPLEDVYLQNLSNKRHAHTDRLGLFKLRDVKIGDSIRVTLVGYQPKLITVSSNEQDIQLSQSNFQLDEVVVSEGVNHLSSVAAVDIATNPVNSAQELLRKVPGLFIGQHAGGGKAEQLFLRGFDLDHGTDINISVDGMPVNMVSHAHGQGYADLHFLIPELVSSIDFDKGPYHADKGNLATAGYVAFETKERLEHNSLTFEGGKFNTFKGLGQFSLLNNDRQSAYIAGSYIETDGPFEASQDFKRLNLMGKYTRNFNDADRLSISAMHFSSSWLASGQIPQRAVDNGLISRFGAIDPNEGGKTSRTNVNLKYDAFINEATSLKTSAFYSRYNFELYSNFTFFLNDPVNGDQIRQKEGRNIVGLESVLEKRYFAKDIDFSIKAGAGVRGDLINDIELSHTLDRTTVLEQIQFGDVNEWNGYAFINADIDFGKLLINPALRVDYFRFGYTDHLNNNLFSSTRKAAVSPKLNFLYNENPNLQFFLKLGKGFHSNDSRVVLAQRTNTILPAAYGADLGLSWKPAPRLILNAAAWYLYLQQEFVYVGDEGVVEPSGRTARKGIDFGLRYQLNNWLFLNGDITYNHGRALDEPIAENYIPLAPPFTFTGGLNVKDFKGFSGSLKSRYLASRPANEDNSIVAKGYFITDANVNYSWKRFSIGLITENIFDREWNETQFATESRLLNEANPVDEIHFTPGTPFNIRAVLSIKF
ncbi:TonB-dependent receptor [Pedobacter sandarakinus]|uniref:TonB-dependent receptor n=1 Tax=Pedobacter sandarakinus TaxID=353156 RepID=UPI002246C057|nr:TonB-dependent receptor [Pedobacter sandarakinus]MCX2574864.1 TonB-dependent receptor [Pedobacter sandarakinus]